MKLNQNLKNTFSLFSVEFISRLLGFVAVTYLARVLGKDGFGLINIGLAVLGYGIIVANSGLSFIGTRKIAGTTEDSGEFTSSLLQTRFFLSILVYLITALIVFLFVSSEETIEVILIFNLYLLPAALLLEWFFLGKQRMDMIAYSRVIGIAIYLLLLLLFVKNENDVAFTGIAWTIGGVVSSIFLFVIFKKKSYLIKFHFKNFKPLSLLKESLPLGGASIISQFVMMFPIIYIGIILTEADAGLYSAAYKIIVLFLVFDRVFNSLFFPKIIKSYEETPQKLEDIFNRILKLITLFSLSASLIVIILSDYLITFVFGKEYFEAVPVLKILTGLFVFTLINSVFTYTLIAMKKEKIFTAAIFSGMILFLASTIIFINFYGIIAPAVSLLVYEIAALSIMAVKLSGEIKIKFLKYFLLPSIGASAIIVLLLSLEMNFTIQLLLTLFAGIPLILFLGGFNFNDIKFIKKVFV